jgi:membrane-associated phospholipid phosphatase
MRNAFFDWYFFAASVLGEEIFFISFVPFCCWNVSRQVALHMTFLLAFAVGGGNMLKNWLQSPRPPHKIVWVNKGNPEFDHGFPSTHTMTAFTIPWYLLVFYWETASASIRLVGLIVLILWSLSIAVSRIYNGHHYIVDVVGGFFLSVAILLVWTQYLRYVIDPFISHPSLLIPTSLIGAALGILYIHPPPPSPNPTTAETALVVGTCIGTAIGVWTYFYGWLPTGLGYKLIDLTGILSDTLALLFARFLIGAVLTAIARELAKRVYLPILLHCHFKYMANQGRKVLYTKKNYKHTQIDTLLKLLTYTTIGFVVVIAPHLCCMLGLFHESDVVIFVK